MTRALSRRGLWVGGRAPKVNGKDYSFGPHRKVRGNCCVRRAAGSSWVKRCSSIHPEALPDATPLRICLVGKTSAGHWVARPEDKGAASELLARFGHVPLPPYIRKGRAAAADRERYQTVYARHPARLRHQRPACTSRRNCSTCYMNAASKPPM